MALNSPGEQQTSEFEQLLKKSTSELIEKVESGDLSDAVNLIQRINDERNRNLYLEVGRLTRALHDSITNFHIDVGVASPATEEMSQMANATDRLNYVIKMTQDAANQTMDKVDESAPVADRLRDQASSLRKDWARLVRREMKPEEFRDLYRRIDDFLKETEEQSDSLSGNFNEIILAQGYQDLTGQVLIKVITLVQEIEENLVNLVCMAGQVDKITGIKHEITEKQQKEAHAPEGPVVDAEERVDVMSGQDDVDGLLSSLGF
jgi:chemotaxis protein CheZ